MDKIKKLYNKSMKNFMNNNNTRLVGRSVCMHNTSGPPRDRTPTSIIIIIIIIILILIIISTVTYNIKRKKYYVYRFT